MNPVAQKKDPPPTLRGVITNASERDPRAGGRGWIRNANFGLCLLVGLILLTTGTLKFTLFPENSGFLRTPDPVFSFLLRKTVLALAAVVEVLAACYLLFGRNAGKKAFLLGWVSGLFGLYRLGGWMFETAEPCPCLGNLGTIFNTSPETIEQISTMLFAIVVTSALCQIVLLQLEKRFST